MQDSKDNTIHQGKSLLTRLISLSHLKAEMHDCDAVIEYWKGHAIAHLITEHKKKNLQFRILLKEYELYEHAHGHLVPTMYARHAWEICSNVMLRAKLMFLVNGCT